jgi:hypothetical protein
VLSTGSEISVRLGDVVDGIKFQVVYLIPPSHSSLRRDVPRTNSRPVPNPSTTLPSSTTFIVPTCHRIPRTKAAWRAGNATMSRPTLLASQTNALLTLLNLNQPPPASGSSSGSFPAAPSQQAAPFEDGAQGPLVWKVLILDELSKDILATSLRVQDLREQGVTLHM